MKSEDLAASMKRVCLFHVTVSAVAMLVCAACGNSFTAPEPNELTIEMAGTVTDLDTGLPIDSAFIEVRTDVSGGFAEAYSDSTGHYSWSFVYRYFPGEILCPFLVFVSADDFSQEIFPLTCVEGVQTVDVLLERSPLAEERSQRRAALLRISRVPPAG